jgi:hypothetical protein
MAVTHISIGKVTGDDGRRLKIAAPGGTVALPGSMPPSLTPSYGSGAATVDASGTMDRLDLALVHVSSGQYAGVRLLFGFDLPFGRKKQTVSVHGSTPALN